MSLHQQISLRLSNKALAGFVLASMAAGVLLPVIISPPHFLSVEVSNNALFAEIAKLEAELRRLQSLKEQQGLSPEEKDEIDRKMDVASARLSKGLRLSQENRSRFTPPAARPRPPIPQAIKYTLPADGVGAVPRVFIPRMPDLAPLEVAERKDMFIKILLPLILLANDEIKNQRQKIDAAYQQGNRKVLEAYARQYKVGTKADDSELYQALAMRAAPIPVSLALAQAAIESGWGQSRFTASGNALFGQWVWNDKEGIKPKQASDSRASVRAFPDLLASVRAYMLNLNSFYAYEAFRKNRALYIQNKTGLDKVVAELSVYAEIGEEYVDTLQTVIAQNDFDRFNSFTLKAASL